MHTHQIKVDTNMDVLISDAPSVPRTIVQVTGQSSHFFSIRFSIGSSDFLIYSSSLCYSIDVNH